MKMMKIIHHPYFSICVVDHWRNAFNKRLTQLGRKLLPWKCFSSSHHWNCVRGEVRGGEYQRDCSILSETRQQSRLASNISGEKCQIQIFWEMLTPWRTPYQRHKFGKYLSSRHQSTWSSRTFTNNHLGYSEQSSDKTSRILFQ